MSKETRPAHENPGYELSDAQFKPVVVAGIALFSLMLVALALSYGLHEFFEKRHAAENPPPPPLAAERLLPEGPRLQVHPELDLQKFNARQDSLINSTGWVSREAGVVRIPVERAMELMLERGYPVRPQNEQRSGDRR